MFDMRLPGEDLGHALQHPADAVAADGGDVGQGKGGGMRGRFNHAMHYFIFETLRKEN